MWEVGPGQWLASIEIFTSPDNVNWQEFLFDTIELRLDIVVADVLPSTLSDQGSQLRNSETFKIFHNSWQIFAGSKISKAGSLHLPAKFQCKAKNIHLYHHLMSVSLFLSDRVTEWCSSGAWQVLNWQIDQIFSSLTKHKYFLFNLISVTSSGLWTHIFFL